MPLVPESTYLAWFSRTSWVYRAYAYLFVNPLWTKRVPSGASLCPAFWLALFSLTLFRPLVYLTLEVRWVARMLRVTDLLHWTDRKAERFFGQENPFPALGFFTVALTVVWGTLGGLAFIAVSNIVIGIIAAASAGLLLPCIAFFIVMLTAAICALYVFAHKDNPDRCRVEIHLLVVIGLTLAGLAIFHPTSFIEVFIGYPLMALGAVWAAVVWTAAGLWASLCWLVLGALTGAMYTLLALGTVLILGVIGWLTSGWLPLGAPAAPPKPALTDKQIRDNVNAITEEVIISTVPRVSWDYIIRVVQTYGPAMDLARARVIAGPGDVPEGLVKALIEKVYNRMARDEARRAARSAACKRTVAILTALVSPITVTWRQAKVGWSYAKALAKAIKAKQCPYIRFED